MFLNSFVFKSFCEIHGTMTSLVVFESICDVGRIFIIFCNSIEEERGIF